MKKDGIQTRNRKSSSMVPLANRPDTNNDESIESDSRDGSTGLRPYDVMVNTAADDGGDDSDFLPTQRGGGLQFSLPPDFSVNDFCRHFTFLY